MTPPQVMVVEDEAIIALSIQRKLQKFGYEVPIVVSSGEEAVEISKTVQLDLILMDIMLAGEINGIQAVTKIREKFDGPVVYLTAYSDNKTLEEAKSTQPSGYLLKPFQERELYATVEMALYKYKIEKDLKQHQQWLATTLKSITNGVIATNKQGIITFINPMAESLTGWQATKVIGKKLATVFNVIDPTTEQPIKKIVLHIVNTGQPVNQLTDYTLLIAKDGTKIPIDYNAAPIQDEDNNSIGVVLAFRDITEHRQAKEVLKRQATELEAQNAELDAFAHTVAHDLKSPLNKVLGFSEILSYSYNSLTEEESKQYLDDIRQSVYDMNNIVDGLLLLAGVRQQKITPGPIDMAPIIAKACQRLADKIEQHQAELILPQTWPTVLGYMPWIEEVWVNYLSNAIKYGGHPPRIEMGAISQTDNMVHFWIQDNGAGLSLEEQERLFVPFERLEQVKLEGHGLGLSIVKRIVEKLGGEVGVESENIPGKGCTFFFNLHKA